MRFDLEYRFNNESLPKFDEYEIKVINNIKYFVTKIDNTINMSNYTVISFDEYQTINRFYKFSKTIVRK